MARQRLSALAAPDLVAPSRADASMTGPVAGDGRVAQVLPYRRPGVTRQGPDFHSFVSQVVELAMILTGADGSAIAFRGEQGTICWARSGEGVPPIGAPVDITSGISRQCLDSGAALRCDDIARDGRVDPEIAEAIGICAVAVVPICSDGEISGILEVVSGTPGSFTDQHLERLQQLANLVSSAATKPAERQTGRSNADAGHPDITLLVELEPAYRAFFRNLADLVRGRSPGPLALSSSEMDVWNDVLVDARVPWRRFLESVLLHVVAVGLFSGLSRVWPQELLLYPPKLRDAHVTYYPPSPSFPAARSSPPKVHLRPPETAAHQEVVRPGNEPEPVVTSDNRISNDAQKMRAMTIPPPAVPMSAISGFRKTELGAAVLPPPPDIDKARGHPSRLPNVSVVSPFPDAGRGSGLQRLNPSRPAGAVIAVSPPPSLNDRATLTHAPGNNSQPGIEVVGPPSSVPARIDARTSAGPPGGGVLQVAPPPPSIDSVGNSIGIGRGTSLAGGSSQVVAPTPSIDGVGSSVGIGRGTSLAGGSSPVVAPAPSLPSGANVGGGGRTYSLGHTASQVVPPTASAPLGEGGNSGSGGRPGALARGGPETVLPPGSAQGGGGSKSAGTGVANNGSTQPAPGTGSDGKHPVFQDVQLRVIALTWAPPRSSYFSNFEVFIAEKWLNKKEPEVIKLVYEFLPYQQRLSEYRLSDLKVGRLRVTRDSSCDESLMQMAWPEGENGAGGPHSSREAGAPLSRDSNNALPCYRTTADDYRRAVSRRR